MNLCIVCNVSEKANSSHVCKICQNEQFERLRNKYGRAKKKKKNYYNRAIPFFERNEQHRTIAKYLGISESYVTELKVKWRKENDKKAKQKRSI